MQAVAVTQRAADQGGGSKDGEKQGDLRCNLKAEQRKFADELEVQTVEKDGNKYSFQFGGLNNWRCWYHLQMKKRGREIGVNLGIKNLFRDMDMVSLRSATGNG